LIELGAIELYGRMLKLPYWTCLGASDQDPIVSSEINDWWEELAGDPRNTGRLMGYLQYQMRAQGVYDGEINGRGSEALLRGVRAYSLALGLPDDLNLDVRFLRKYLAADQAQVRKIAVLKLAEINQKEGPLPPEPVAQAAPPGAPAAAGAQTAQQTAQATPGGTGASTAPTTSAPQTASAAQGPAIAQGQTAGTAQTVAAASSTQATTGAGAARPATPPVPAASAAGAPAALAQTAPPASAATRPVASAAPAHPAAAGIVPAVYRPAAPVATIPIEGSRPANNSTYRAGEPFFVGVISPRDGYLYCYMIDDQQRISQFYPAPAQSPSRLSGGTLTVLNSNSPLLASRPEHKEKVACFSSPKDLGRQPLEPASVQGLDALKTRFAIAVSGAYAMGVFDVNVQ
jgi:hypothetical protein